MFVFEHRFSNRVSITLSKCIIDTDEVKSAFTPFEKRAKVVKVDCLAEQSRESRSVRPRHGMLSGLQGLFALATFGRHHLTVAVASFVLVFHSFFSAFFIWIRAC